MKKMEIRGENQNNHLKNTVKSHPQGQDFLLLLLTEQWSYNGQTYKTTSGSFTDKTRSTSNWYLSQVATVNST